MLTYISLSGFYHVYFETSHRSGSLGKHYLGLEVKTEQGEALDKRTAVLRWFSAALSHLSQNIGFLIAAFTEKRLALHDFLAHTLVLERETRDGAFPINRNKRAIIILIAGIIVMPIVLTACMMVPLLHFIQKEQQAELERHQKMAALAVPIQQALQKRMSVDQHCLSQDDEEIKPLLLPLKPLTSEVYVGLTEDEQACEIYMAWDTYQSLNYRYTGVGGWTCEASEKAADFGQNCQLSDY
jgi:RDD family